MDATALPKGNEIVTRPACRMAALIATTMLSFLAGPLSAEPPDAQQLEQVRQGAATEAVIMAVGDHGDAQAAEALIAGYKAMDQLDRFQRHRKTRQIKATLKALCICDAPEAHRFLMDELRKDPRKLTLFDPPAFRLPANEEDIEALWKHLNDKAAGERLRPMDRSVRGILLTFKHAPVKAGPQHLIEAMAHGNGAISQQATIVFGLTREPRMVPYLREALKDERPGIRAAALKKLANWRDRSAVEDYFQLLTDPDMEVREKAQTALRLVTHYDAGADKASLQRWWRRNEAVFNDPTDLITDLQKGGRFGYHAPLSALCQMKDEKALRAVVDYFPNRENGHSAAYLLGRTADPDILLPILAEKMKDGDKEMRTKVLSALRRCLDPRAITLIIDALDDKDTEVRHLAEKTLRGLTRQDLGSDRKAWMDWWEKSKDRFVCLEMI